VILEIAEGTADFGTLALVIDKLGVSLKGAGERRRHRENHLPDS
jgi:hypothetical protein